jgi:hypothetical protein
VIVRVDRRVAVLTWPVRGVKNTARPNWSFAIF